LLKGRSCQTSGPSPMPMCDEWQKSSLFLFFLFFVFFHLGRLIKDKVELLDFPLRQPQTHGFWFMPLTRNGERKIFIGKELLGLPPAVFLPFKINVSLNTVDEK